MRYFAIGLGVIAALAAGVRLHSNLVDRVTSEAVRSERLRAIDAAKVKVAAAEKRVNEVERAASAAEEAHKHEREQLKQMAADGAAAARAERDKLRAQLATAVRGGGTAQGGGSGTGAVTDVLGPVANALSECSGRYAEVAGIADALSIQVTGLQQWVHTAAQVCPVDMGSAQGSE